jgi:hypothetical protein
MKHALLILTIATGSLLGFNAKGNTATSETATQDNTIIENTPGPRKPGSNMGMRRMRSKIFTVNVGHFNKKIMAKYDREQKALALAAKSGKEKRADRKAKRMALRTA